jgi:hypothetical protein
LEIQRAIISQQKDEVKSAGLIIQNLQ